MSGVHFAIQSHGDFAEIRDLGSTNKTWVNGVSVASLKLSPKDRIRAGKTLFSIEWKTSLGDDDSSESAVSGFGMTSDVPLPSNPLPVPPPSARAANPLMDSSSASYSVPSDKAVSQAEENAVPEPFARTPDLANPPYTIVPSDHRNSSPFESVDQSFLSAREIEKVPWAGAIPGQKHVQDWDSPFDDGSVVVPESISESGKQFQTDPDLTDSSDASYAFRRLRQRAASATDFDFAQIVSQLSTQEECRIVAHFLKIGERTPTDLGGVPVIPSIAAGKEYFPVLIEKKRWQSAERRSLTQRLILADGFLLVILHRDANANAVLQAISSRGASGFSEPNGLLTWFWPSHMFALNESLSDALLTGLLGTEVEGVVFAAPQLKHGLCAIANRRLQALLADFGFE